nr:MAG TPA: hypothetical protein [Caudoviricetes sp.]
MVAVISVADNGSFLCCLECLLLGTFCDTFILLKTI